MSTPLDRFIEAFKDQGHYPDCLCMCGPGARCDCTFDKDVAEILKSRDADYDPTHYCSHCGARESRFCDCGPISKDD